jgi:nicotinamide-nucleotide amidase
MNAEIIAVGSELLTPQRIDTNSLYITQHLNALGVEVLMKSVVGDDRSRLAQQIHAALERVDVVVLTGGLGPTEDDVTRDAAAAALGRTQSFRQDVCDEIAARFARMQRPMAENNKRQAMIIDGAEVLPNPNGTAPGQWLRQDGKVAMLLPGPPREMKAMFSDQCLPRLAALLPVQVIRVRAYRVAGLGESDLDQIIAPIYMKFANPVTTVLADVGDIQVHLRARSDSEEQANALLEEVGAQIEAALGERLYTNDGQPLEAVVGRRLKERGETLSVAESCTGGLLAERITSIAGSSAYFRGGFLTYCDELKTALLGVDPRLLQAHTAVSEPVARAMAEGCRERSGSTYAVSVTGHAGPEGGTPENPVGTVFIGLAGPAGCRVVRIFSGGDRGRVRRMASQVALDTLRKTLF